MGLDVDIARAHVERVIASRIFETSEIHRRLLRYLAEKSLLGQAENLKEYTIGIEAFGKPESYDPRQDSIVRLQASRLRQKLTAYYLEDHPEDTLRLDLPKGAFKLEFRPIVEPDLEVTEKGLLGIWSSTPRAVWIGSIAVLLLLCIGLLYRNLQLSKRLEVQETLWNSELAEIWTPFLESKRPVLVCVGTPYFARVPMLGFFRDPRANTSQEIEKSERLALIRKLAPDQPVLESRGFTGTGEANAAFLIGRLLSPRRTDLQFTRSNLLSWEQINTSNVIFLGPPKFNTQLQTSALMQDLVVEADGVRNRKPQPGEPEFFADQLVPGLTNEGTTHALITRSRGLSGIGEFLVISGNASPDTLAAAEWLTQGFRAAQLANRLRDSNGELPKYFQVLLKVQFKQGVPVESSYVLHHVLKDQDKLVPPTVKR